MENETRLIDVNVPVDFLMDQKVKETGAFSKGVNKGIDIAISALRNTEICPNVEAVEVVRCKDCKVAFTNPFIADYPLLVCRKQVNWHVVEPDDFCSYGERREGE